MAMVTLACQSEEPFETDIDAELTLAAESSVTEMMRRTTSKDGSYDNIVDGASCLSIQFPYAVTVNGVEIYLETIEDLARIEKILDTAEQPDGTDYGNEWEAEDGDEVGQHDEKGQPAIEIAYPILVTTADYTDIEIHDAAELDHQAGMCAEGGGDTDIECADLRYPIDLFTYNPSFQQTGNLSVADDKEFWRFLAGLTDIDLISLDFPVVLELSDGSELSVNTNSEMGEALKLALDSCDEDDDTDHNDDDFTKGSLDSLLVTCPWMVKKLKRAHITDAENYQDYLLVFNADRTLISDDGLGPVSEGEWSVTVSDYRVFLNLQFEDDEAFNVSMYTYDLGDSFIKMVGEESDEVVLEQSCTYGEQTCSDLFIEENLQSGCRWSITDGKGEFVQHVEIDFSQEHLLAYDSDHVVVDEGEWDISEAILTFDDLNGVVDLYEGDWNVVACSEGRLRLQRGNEVLVLVEVCDAPPPE